MSRIRCILFDRDGTLGALIDKRYPQTLVPYGNIKALFSSLKEKGYLVGIITNQSSIARGTGAGYPFEEEFTAWGADVWKICPHDNADNCNCRKPKSGLLYAACEALGITPQECLVVGDRLSDIACAKNAGADGVLVLTGNGETEQEQVKTLYPDVQILPSVHRLLAILP